MEISMSHFYGKQGWKKEKWSASWLHYFFLSFATFRGSLLLTAICMKMVTGRVHLFANNYCC